MSGEIDLRQLRALLGTYVRMSLRGKSAGTFFRRRPGKWRGTVALVVLYAGIGTVAAIGSTGAHNAFSYALVMHTITFVMLGMSLAVESGDLLFHLAEHEVLGHLPVGGRTLLVAKAASLLGFALLLAFAMNVPAVLYGLRLEWLGPWFAPVHLGAVALLAALSSATVVFSYGLVVRFVDRERFDGVAAWAQAGLSASFLGLSQGLAHLVELPIIRVEAAFCLIFPPAWFAALDLVGTGAGSSRALTLSLLAFGVTVGLGWAALTRLAPGYATAFVRLPEAQPGPRARVEREPGRLLAWWLRDPIERAGFRLAATYVRRDREIRTRLYPALGFFLLLPLAQLMSHAAYRFRAAAILAVLLLGMLPSIALEALRVSSHHTAAEVFAAAPLTSAGPLFQGVRKATVYYVLLPGALAALAWILFMDPRILPLALPSLIALPALSVLPGAFRQYVPLSVPPTLGRQSLANIVLGVFTTAIGGATLLAAWVAWRLGWLPHLLVAEILLLVLGSGALNRRIDRRPLRGVG